MATGFETQGWRQGRKQLGHISIGPVCFQRGTLCSVSASFLAMGAVPSQALASVSSEAIYEWGKNGFTDPGHRFMKRGVRVHVDGLGRVEA